MQIPKLLGKWGKKENLVANCGDFKEKSTDNEIHQDSRSDWNSQPGVPCTIEGHSVPEVDKTILPEKAVIEL